MNKIRARHEFNSNFLLPPLAFRKTVNYIEYGTEKMTYIPYNQFSNPVNHVAIADATIPNKMVTATIYIKLFKLSMRNK